MDGHVDVALDHVELEHEACTTRLGKRLLERPHLEEVAQRGACGCWQCKLGMLVWSQLVRIWKTTPLY